jgi:hypothetical protein
MNTKDKAKVIDFLLTSDKTKAILEDGDLSPDADDNLLMI